VKPGCRGHQLLQALAFGEGRAHDRAALPIRLKLETTYDFAVSALTL